MDGWRGTGGIRDRTNIFTERILSSIFLIELSNVLVVKFVTALIIFSLLIGFRINDVTNNGNRCAGDDTAYIHISLFL